jgi:hypothetical protein
MAGEIAPICRAPHIGAIGKQPEQFQKTGNGLSPSVTLTHHPLNAYLNTNQATLENLVPNSLI